MAYALQMQYNRRDRLPTYKIYEDNYGYTMNYYKPMIDYLDAKEKHVHFQYPHLPWSNERGLKKYSSNNLVKNYTEKDIKKYSIETSAKAKERQQHLDDYKVIRRLSPLSVTQSARGARIGKHFGSGATIEEKTIHKLEERAKERKFERIMADIEASKSRFNKMAAENDIEISTSLKNAVRGKTASQITAALLAESEKHIKESRLAEEKYSHLKSTATSQYCVSGGNAKIIKRTTHIDLMDDRMLDHLGSTMTTSLCDVKRELNNFNQRTAELYHDSRWRKKLF